MPFASGDAVATESITPPVTARVVTPSHTEVPPSPDAEHRNPYPSVPFHAGIASYPAESEAFPPAMSENGAQRVVTVTVRGVETARLPAVSVPTETPLPEMTTDTEST